MSVTLIRSELDQWQPAEHTATFRDYNLAFVTGAIALEHCWSNKHYSAKDNTYGPDFIKIVKIFQILLITVQERGMTQGLNCGEGSLAQAVHRHAFTQRLIIETSGARNHAIKCMPPLMIWKASALLPNPCQ